MRRGTVAKERFLVVNKLKSFKRVDTLSYKTISANKETATKEWVVVDATDQVLGRLGAKVAKLLRGKYKPNFTPNADCGDNVIIINADKVVLTGNIQGDIVAVYSGTGTKLVSYTYDAWGNHTVTYHNGGESTVAVNNPFRYRGYYYDADLELYYLNSRYYDSKIGRFISSDAVEVITASPTALTRPLITTHT